MTARPTDEVPTSAPRLRRPVLFDQRWRNLVFLHWPVDPDAVAPLFPPGARPDLFEGRTYVGLIAFDMARAGFGRSLRVPYLGDFLETNVRLYSIDDAGRHGIVFRSLETQRLAVAAFARRGRGVPYTWARMSQQWDGPVVEFASVRRWPSHGAHTRIALHVGDPLVPTPLEVWLTARFGLHTRVAGRTRWIPNRHEAWPLHHAHLLDLDDELVTAAGITTTGPLLRPLWSPGVRTQFGRPTALAAGRPRRIALRPVPAGLTARQQQAAVAELVP